MIGTRLKLWLKWTWVAIVLAFVGWYVAGKREVIQSAIEAIDWRDVALAAAFLIGGKLCLGETMRHAAAAAGIAFRPHDSFRIYNLTQIAKYVPGSIWQFVGRIAMLRERGVPMSAIRDSIIAEQLWVLASAATVGACLVGLHAALSPELPTVTSFEESYWAFGLLAALFLGVGLIFRNRLPQALRAWIWRLRPSAQAAVCLGLAWISFGLAFYVTLPAFGFPEALWYYAIGAYALGYVVGLVMPFAPAGLGVRDAFLALSVAPFVGFDAAVVLAGLNRIIYICCEIVLAGLATRIPHRA